MTNIPKSFYKTDPNLVANLAMVCEVTLKENPMVETCTQSDVRYYVQVRSHRGEWINHRHILYKSGFKSLKSAKKMLNKANKGLSHTDVYVETFRLVKQTRTIEIKTTTEIEVLDD